MKNKYYIVIIFILMMMLFYNQSCVKQKHNFIKETMANTPTVDDNAIMDAMKTIYNVDISAITNLADTAVKMQTSGITTGGYIDVQKKLSVSGDFTITGNSNLIPKGIIIGWATDKPPQGWALCDGTNGTPDLRGRFILGADATKQINTVGGSELITIKPENLPDHWHNIKTDSLSKVLDEGATLLDTLKDGEGGKNYRNPVNGDPHKFTLYNNGGSGADSIDSLMASSQAVTLLNLDRTPVRKPTDVVEPISIMPQYYVLTYIIKL
jgi:hypothetical protein